MFKGTTSSFRATFYQNWSERDFVYISQEWRLEYKSSIESVDYKLFQLRRVVLPLHKDTPFVLCGAR